jgi:hypothetical protein
MVQTPCRSTISPCESSRRVVRLPANEYETDTAALAVAAAAAAAAVVVALIV